MLFTLDGAIEQKIEEKKVSENGIEEEKTNGDGKVKAQEVMDIEAIGNLKAEIDKEQCKIIFGRILVFLNAFKTKISAESKW